MEFKQEVTRKISIDISPIFSIGDVVYRENSEGTIYISAIISIKIYDGCIYYYISIEGSLYRVKEDELKLYK